MMNKGASAFSAFTTAIFLTVAAHAEGGREGWYGGLDLGLAISRDMDMRGRSDDVPTNCDQHLGRATVNGVSLPLPLSDPRCARGSEGWKSSFDIDNGPLLGLNVGYAWRGFRFEAEYFYRQHDGEYSGSEITSGDKQPEFIQSGERISDIRGHQFFGNVYYDFRDTRSKLIPYIGGGMGLMLARMDYSAGYLRNSDQNVIGRLGRNPNAAGTLSSQNEVLSDVLWGYQLLAGADYTLTERVFLGVKARYVDFLNDLEDSGLPNILRSHAPTVAPGGDDVRNEFRTDDFGFWGVSLNIKYFF